MGSTFPCFEGTNGSRRPHQTSLRANGLSQIGLRYRIARAITLRISSKPADMSTLVEVAPLVPRKQSGVFSTLASWQAAVLVLLLASLYSSILARLFTQWRNDPNFSHGFFVPLFALFVLWKNRERLKAIAPSPSWTGLILIVGGLLCLLLGV